MGTNFKNLVVAKPISIDSLNGKILFVDSFNILYQFLSSIRQPDGTPLMTSTGLVSSHLIGLFNRTTKLMSQGLKLVFVFDGEPPKLKHQERLRRASLKKDAQEKFEKAKQEDDIEGMKKYASRTSRLTTEMVKEAKQLIKFLGLPVIQAPSEGEAQAAHMVIAGKGYGVVSEDYDSLLFGVPRMIRGLTITKRKKERDALSYVKTDISLIELDEVLNRLKINQDQLIALGMLVGTDFNPGGIKGIGPKKALQLVQSTPIEKIFENVEWDFQASWTEVFSLFKEMPTIDAEFEFGKVDSEKLKELLIGKYEFSENSVEKKLKQLEKAQGGKNQSSLGDFI